jgi:DNA-binding response OmpR family regulator
MNQHHQILIVDDEPNVRLMFRTTLESTGETTAEAEDGEAALAMLAASTFDLVLLDLQMPGIDGMETLRRLRAAGDETPVVIVTAHGSVPHAVEAMKLGAIDFLSKPLTPDALRHVVAEVCSRGRVAGPGKSGRRDDEPITVVGEFVANLARAKVAINRREFTPAEVYLKQALALNDGSAEAHNLMGVLRELRNDHDGSYKSYRAALRVDPRYEPAKHNMTRYYERFTFGASNVPVDTGEGTVG